MPFSFYLACSRSFQTVGNRQPFTGFGQRLHDDQLSAGFIALVQLVIDRPGECLGVVRDHAYLSKSLARWNLRVSDDVDFRALSIPL